MKRAIATLSIDLLVIAIYSSLRVEYDTTPA